MFPVVKGDKVYTFTKVKKSNVMVIKPLTVAYLKGYPYKQEIAVPGTLNEKINKIVFRITVGCIDYTERKQERIIELDENDVFPTEEMAKEYCKHMQKLADINSMSVGDEEREILIKRELITYRGKTREKMLKYLRDLNCEYSNIFS